MSKCRHCGKKLDTEKEKERGICHDCMHKGFWKLAEVLGKKMDEAGKEEDGKGENSGKY